MVKFLNGPAEGVELSLRRAPMLLRVAQSPCGSWDALDQVEDEPQAAERIWVYVQSGSISRYHLLCRGKNRAASRWYVNASYKLVADQPSDHHLRIRTAWEAWAMENAKIIKALEEPCSN